jgi:hypothetical protein
MMSLSQPYRQAEPRPMPPPKKELTTMTMPHVDPWLLVLIVAVLAGIGGHFAADAVRRWKDRLGRPGQGR